jgi:hypothetical protein
MINFDTQIDTQMGFGANSNTHPHSGLFPVGRDNKPPAIDTFSCKGGSHTSEFS